MNSPTSNLSQVLNELKHKSPLPGIKIMLMGPTGTGKTWSIRSWIRSDVNVCAIFTEPSFEVVGDIPCPQLHWKYISPMSVSWDEMLDGAEKINRLNLKGLANLDDINKSKYREFITLVKACNKFVCDRCGADLGSVDTWGTNRCLYLDSLSGLNLMAMNLVVGSKPIKSMGDWGIAMDNEERIIQKLACDLHCHFVLTAHLDREMDEQLGQVSLMASALGRKMAPKLPRWFSDVVLARTLGAKWMWSTTHAGVDLKARNLEWGDNLAADIAPGLATWKTRGGIIEEE